MQDCDGLFQLMGEYLANAEERKRYRALFRRQALLAKYRAGDRGIWGEYRCVNFDGEILWAALRATIHEDPETGDILLFGYVRDIEMCIRDRAQILRQAGWHRRSCRFCPCKILQGTGAFFVPAHEKGAKYHGK